MLSKLVGVSDLFHLITQEMIGYDPKVRNKDIFNFHYIEDSISNSLLRIKNQNKKMR